MARCVTEEFEKACACEKSGEREVMGSRRKECCLGLGKEAFVEDKKEETKA